MDKDSLEPSSSQVYDDDSNDSTPYFPPAESSSIEVASSNIFQSFQMPDNNSEAEVIDSRDISNAYLNENFLNLPTGNEVSDSDNNNIGTSIVVADASFASNFILEAESSRKLEIENNAEPGCSSSSSNILCGISKFQSSDVNLGSEALSNNDEILFIQLPRECEPQSSKQADSNCLEKGKAKHKGGKGLKGKGRFNVNISPNLIPPQESNMQHQQIEVNDAPVKKNSNKHSLFSGNSSKPWIRNNENKKSPNPSYDSDSSCDGVFGNNDAPVQTSSPCRAAKKIRLSLNDEESFMVASSSEGISMADTFYIKSPKCSGDALVSSSTGQLDQLPESSMNFQVNDVSNSSLIPSPIIPPVLDSTVDSTSGQNISSPYSEIDEDELDFHCRLEGRNEISTSEHRLSNIVEEHNVLQRSPEASPVRHYMQEYLNLENLNSNDLNINHNSDDNNSAEASALIPTTSAYLQKGMSVTGICLSSNKSYPESSNDTSDVPSPSDSSENLNNLAANESLAFPVDTSTSDVSQQNLLSLDMAVIEVPSSSLTSTTSNFQNDNFGASGSGVGVLNSSSQIYRTTHNLAQINEDYMLGLAENSLNGEDVLAANEELVDESLQLNDRETLQVGSDGDGNSQNFQDSIELGLVPQNLGPFVSRPDQQMLIHSANLLDDCPHLEASNIEFIDCSPSFEADAAHSISSEQQRSFQHVVSNEILPSISSYENKNVDSPSGSRNNTPEDRILASRNRMSNSESSFINISNENNQVVQLLSTNCLELQGGSSSVSASGIIISHNNASTSHENSSELKNCESINDGQEKRTLNIHSLFSTSRSLKVSDSDPSYDPNDDDIDHKRKRKEDYEGVKLPNSLFKNSSKNDPFNVPSPVDSHDNQSDKEFIQDSCSGQLVEPDFDEDASNLTNEICNDFNHLADIGFWCSDCEKFLKSKCNIHRVQTIMDKPILSRAWASLPAQHLMIKQTAIVKESQAATYGVFCRKAIPKRTQFGPLEGTFSEVVPHHHSLVFRSIQNQRNGYINISDEASSNWMRFVRPADTYLEMNCIIIEEDKNIYFLTTTNLPSKAELRVGYSKQYAVKYEYSTLAPTEEEQLVMDQLKKSWFCYECEDSFETSLELQIHLATHDSIDVKPDRKFRKRGRTKKIKFIMENSKKLESTDDLPVDDDNCERPGSSTSFECYECGLRFHTVELFDLHSFIHRVCDESLDDDLSNNNNNNGSDIEMMKDEKFSVNQYSCPQCSLIMHSRKEIAEHVKQHSILIVNVFKCGYCYKSFNSKERLDNHSNIHKNESEKPHACWLCLRRFCTQSALGSHIKFHEDGAVTIYDCPICNTQIDNVSDFKSHFPTHCVDGFYTCPSCSKKFPTYFQIRRHIRSYHSTKNYLCTHCDKLLPSLQKLRFHLAIHSDKREFGCSMCPKRFKRKDKMKDHVKRIHLKRDENKQKLARKFVPKVDPTDYRLFTYKCDQCMLGFKRRGMLVNHMSKRHPDIPVSSVPELNQPIVRTCHTYVCEYCEKSYASMTKRKQHIIKNHPGAELPTAKYLQKEDVSKVTFAASCHLCPRQYMTKAKLLQHQRKTHPQESDDLEAGPSSEQSQDLLARAIDKFSPEYISKVEEEIVDSPIVVNRESVSAVLNPDGSLSLRPLYVNKQNSPEEVVTCPLSIPVEGAKIIVRNSSLEEPLILDNIKTPSLVVWQPSLAFNSSNM